MKLTISIKTIRMALAGLAVLSMSACEGLLPDNKVDLDLTDKNASQVVATPGSWEGRCLLSTGP